MFMIFINNLYSYIFPKQTDILGNQNILCQGKSIDLSHYHNLVCFFSLGPGPYSKLHECHIIYGPQTRLIFTNQLKYVFQGPNLCKYLIFVSYSWPHCWTKLVQGTPQEVPGSKKGKNKNIFTSKFELSSVFKIPRATPGASKK